MVEGVDEVSTELQFDPFRDREVLVQAHVNAGKVRRTQVSKLIWTSAKEPDSWIGEVAIVCEPLVATDSRCTDRSRSGDGRD